jgi:hypothetical protein
MPCEHRRDVGMGFDPPQCVVEGGPMLREVRSRA